MGLTGKKGTVRPGVAVVVPLLVLAVGCGGSDGTSGKGAEERPGSGSSALPEANGGEDGAAGPALDGAALERALLTDGEAKGYRSSDPDQEPLTPTADRTECQPLADLTAYGTDRSPKARAFAGRTFSGTGTETAGEVMAVSLLSYGGRDAADTVKGVRAALEACGDGFETTGNNGGETIRYTAVEEGEAPGDGDEAVAVELVGEADGGKVPMNFAVVRSGSVLAQFMTLSLSNPEGTPVPGQVVTAQVDKLSGAEAG